MQWTRWIVVALFLAACGSKKSALDDVQPMTSGRAAAHAGSDDGDGLELRLSNGSAGAPAFDRGKLAPTTKLADAATTTLLERAPAIVTNVDDKKAFALRPASLPPPKTGTTITQAFPPDPATQRPPAPTPATPGALAVLRYMPEGQVPLAPELSVTFDQPMVAVTSQEDAATTTPVKLTPTPKGRWRWLGTRTILFDPDVRFPQATTYTIEIPAGTKSATGAALAKATTFSFETPPPGVEQTWPYDNQPQRVDTPMFLRFDQKIDPAAVLAKIKVTASSGWDAERTYQLKLLDAAAIAKLDELHEVVDAAHANEQDGRWLAFATTQPFPADASVTIEVPVGTPSAEGPNVTKERKSFSFRTYPPLKLVESWCSYRNEHCRPGTAFELRFSTSIDAEKLDPASIVVKPAIAGIRVQPSGNTLYITGATTARTHYDVTVPKRLVDAFGQTLGADETRGFDVQDADPTFYGPSGMVVLDPSAKHPTLDFFTTNWDALKVRLYKVAPSDYDAYVAWQQQRWDQEHRDAPPPGTLVLDTVVKTGAGKNLLAEDHVDLAKALGPSGLGHVIAVVEPSPFVPRYPTDRPQQLVTWVQGTHLGLETHFDAEKMHVFTTELATGKPLAGVRVAWGDGAATTDATGLATVPHAGAATMVASLGDDRALVLATTYQQLLRDEYRKLLAWYIVDDRKLYRPGETVSLKGWMRVTDRGLGGDLGLVGASIAKVTYTARDSRGNELAKGDLPVSLTGTFDTTFVLPKTPNLGRVNITFRAEGTGVATSSLVHNHYVRVEEFRRPEFEVKAHASQGPFLVGEAGDVSVDATYFAGGGLAGAPVHWDARASQTSFTPPNRDDYAFGAWSPWWEDGPPPFEEDGDDMPRYGRYNAGAAAKKHKRTSWTLDAKTDGGGSHTLHFDFVSVKPAVPMSVITTASVTDVNRQQWSASASMIVHPATYYVGLHAKRPFVEQGTPFDLDVIGVDLDGKLAPNAKITVVASREDQVYVKGRYTTKEVEPQTCTLTMVASAPHGRNPGEDGAQPCHFTTVKGGRYTVLATITDPKGRTNTSRSAFWVSGGERIPSREVTEEDAPIIPDKKTYSPGNTAELLVMSPFYPAEGVVTWRRGGIAKIERITLTGPTKVIKVPIEDAMTPNLFVRVDLVGAAARLDDKGVVDPKLPKRPAYAVGNIDLSIPPVRRTLAVTVAPATAKVAPGEATSVALEVRDAAGKPVADAETSVIVVDESILTLAAYTHPDPIAELYGHYEAFAIDIHNRQHVKLARPQAGDLATQTANLEPPAPMPDIVAAAPMEESGGTGTAMALDEGKMGKKDSDRAEGQYKMMKQEDHFGREQTIELARNAGILGSTKEISGGKDAPPDTSPIAIRQNFDPLAAFAATVKTDATGKATVQVKMPDNLTRYRIIAIAASGPHDFGKGESAVTARLPMMVRPSAPRFLNFGDVFQLPVVIQNQTDAPMTVRLAVRATNAKLTDGGGRVVSVPANDRALVQFPATTEMAGTARFQFVAETDGGTRADAAEVSLPVWTPATTEAFATYGVIDDGAVAQPVALPGNVVPQFGGLEVSTASTNLGALTDALLYIVHYPFECSEQRSSRVMSIAALRDVLAAFGGAGLPSIGALASSNATDIAKIAQLQNGDGGFVYWERGYPSEPYLSVYVTHALVLAKAKGYDVPPATLERAKGFLADIEAHYPSDYPEDVRHAISAYALATRRLMGDVDVAKAKKLIAESGGVAKLGLETAGWLLQAIAKQPAAEAERTAIVRHAMNKVSETAGAANFTTGYGDGAYLLLASDRRVDAIMLDALIQEQPASDLIPKLVTGLLAHRKAGRWLSTQENTWVLLALDRYFQTYEKTTPNFTARVWLGKDYAGDHAFAGRTTDTFAIAIAMADVVAHDKTDLVIQKDGVGRMYYRVGMRYAPASLQLAAADYGFVVTRTYEGVDDPKDVMRAADGVWHVKAGARVRVKLQMANENRRYHVALVDPMPAGFEAQNPALATTPPVPAEAAAKNKHEGGRYWWWYRTWYEHQNMRDERVEAFTQLLWEGVHDYAYVARATTPGNFIVPPSKAEEMYMPETFGRTASDRVIVE